mmetsp:Transcript_40213/g.65164  ORF Transcript_40213/g.65164 Transcript_40213/m.65164 type:complete len:87 (+) Transcript_40213:189-449(+)
MVAFFALNTPLAPSAAPTGSEITCDYASKISHLRVASKGRRVPCFGGIDKYLASSLLSLLCTLKAHVFHLLGKVVVSWLEKAFTCQ